MNRQRRLLIAVVLFFIGAVVGVLTVWVSDHFVPGGWLQVDLGPASEPTDGYTLAVVFAGTYAQVRHSPDRTALRREARLWYWAPLLAGAVAGGAGTCASGLKWLRVAARGSGPV